MGALPAVKAEREQALAEIARNHHGALLRFLMIRTGSKAEAEEIAQEAYAKILALDQPGTIGFLLGYLWRTAVHIAVDRNRQNSLRERFNLAVSRDESFEPSSESVADSQERLRIVEKAIDELPPRCYEAFRLRVIEGKKFDEVGQELGISDRMAKKHVARALEYLQDCLDLAAKERRAR
jgi:RNA polymerase sigma-70 factor (ECF subfamily)